MGKTRTAFLGETLPEPSSPKAKDGRRPKPMSSDEGKGKKGEKKRSLKKERGVRLPGMGGGERVVAVTAEMPPEKEQEEETKRAKVAQAPRKRSKRYLATLLKIDQVKFYQPREAVELARQTSLSRFDGKIELHMVLVKRGRFELELPHPIKSAKKKVEIANEETIKKLEGGKIDFDILVSTPQFLPKLVPYARLLGPRGLMPNPKNGTIVGPADGLKKTLERFSGGRLVLQSEKDFPVMHTVIGAVSDPANNLVENLEVIFKAVGGQNIKKAVLSATIGPGIKIAIS